MDCMQGMKEFPDKYFALAIVDPPYGIGENGDKNHTRCKLAKAKNYKAFSGNDIDLQTKNILTKFSEFQKIRLYGVLTILSAKSHTTVVVGLFGIRTIQAILPIASLRGLRLILQ